MHHQYICPRQMIEIESNEFYAFEAWNCALRDGISHYAQCRWDSAQIFLGRAFEIAGVRLIADKNRYFSGLNLLKPYEFLFEVFVSEDAFLYASDYLYRAMALLQHSGRPLTPTEVFALRSYARRLHEKVLTAERQVLSHEAQKQLCQQCQQMSSLGQVLH